MLKEHHGKPIQILDEAIPLSKYTPIDLSSDNGALKTIDVTNPNDCERYITSILKANDATVAFGGYLEKRDLYSKSTRFAEGMPRNIHLGCDFWCDEGTEVLVPFEGTVHSFKNNDDHGNYGPTVVLQHQIKNFTFHSLFGHLSLESLDGLYLGRKIAQGETLGSLGATEINVGYAPHLHFQLIISMNGYEGDYPGVCHQEDMGYYRENCPNPAHLLGI